MTSPDTNETANEKIAGLTRRSVVKGAAWAAPVVAYAAVVPQASASLPPCVGSVNATGGSYPVNVGVAGCTVANTHWDFQFKITAAAEASCDCDAVLVTFYDNPDRSQLWLNQSTDQPQRYVRKTLALGATGTFPEEGDNVYNVSNDAFVGTIVAPGLTQDALHCLINPSGSGAPPSGGSCDDTDGPMATYLVQCIQDGTPVDFPDGQGEGSINICVPQLTATMCDLPGAGNFRMHITVSNACGLPTSNFVVTNIQQNNDTNFPNEGFSVWSGNQVVGAGVDIDFNTGSGQDQFWISFTPDGGTNIVRNRIEFSGFPGTIGAC